MDENVKFPEMGPDKKKKKKKKFAGLVNQPAKMGMNELTRRVKR